MALTQTLPIEQWGLTLDGAYLRVLQLAWHVEGGAHLELGVYATRQARAEGLRPVQLLTSDLTDEERARWFADDALAGRSPIAQAYAYLKTLPQFAEAHDA